MAETRIKVREDTIGIRFHPLGIIASDGDGYHWLSLDEVRAFQTDLAVAVREAWVNHEEKKVEDVVKNTGVAG